MKPVDSEPHFSPLGSGLRLEENEGTLIGHSLEAHCPCAPHLITIRQEGKINAVMVLPNLAPEPALALLFHRRHLEIPTCHAEDCGRSQWRWLAAYQRDAGKSESSYIGLDIKGESQPSSWVMQCQWELR